MAQILDYSAGYPGAAAIRAVGYQGVIRYLRKEGTSRVRPITAAELADLRAHGLDVALIYQTISTARILEGFAAGAHDARWALQQAAAIGAPEPRAIYFAADQDIDATELPKVLAYLDGAASVLGLGRVGIYGEASVVDTALPNHATWGWQTAAWSGGRRAARAHLYQRIGQVPVGGIACDVNDVIQADYGQIQIQQEDDMAWLDELVTDPATGQPKKDKWGNTYTWRTALAYALDAVWSIHDRPVADVDETALAAELDARGIGGVTAAELVEILASVRLAPGGGA